jgi:hypothetical protein
MDWAPRYITVWITHPSIIPPTVYGTVDASRERRKYDGMRGWRRENGFD